MLLLSLEFFPHPAYVHFFRFSPLFEWAWISSRARSRDKLVEVTRKSLSLVMVRIGLELFSIISINSWTMLVAGIISPYQLSYARSRFDLRADQDDLCDLWSFIFLSLFNVSYHCHEVQYQHSGRDSRIVETLLWRRRETCHQDGTVDVICNLRNLRIGSVTIPYVDMSLEVVRCMDVVLYALLI